MGRAKGSKTYIHTHGFLQSVWMLYVEEIVLSVTLIVYGITTPTSQTITKCQTIYRSVLKSTLIIGP